MADICPQSDSDFRLDFPADPYAVRQALRAAVARFRRTMSEDEAGGLEIVLGEALNNVVEHAYQNCGQGPVALHIAAGAKGLTCRVIDQGRPMPEGTLPYGKALEVAAGESVQTLPEGGFGWLLIRDLTRDLTYARDGAQNRLEFLFPVRGVC